MFKIGDIVVSINGSYNITNSKAICKILYIDKSEGLITVTPVKFLKGHSILSMTKENQNRYYNGYHTVHPANFKKITELCSRYNYIMSGGDFNVTNT